MGGYVMKWIVLFILFCFLHDTGIFDFINKYEEIFFAAIILFIIIEIISSKRNNYYDLDSDRYVLNKKSGVIHDKWSDSAKTIKDNHKVEISSYDADKLVNRGKRYRYKK